MTTYGIFRNQVLTELIEFDLFKGFSIELQPVSEDEARRAIKIISDNGKISEINSFLRGIVKYKGKHYDGKHSMCNLTVYDNSLYDLWNYEIDDEPLRNHLGFIKGVRTNVHLYEYDDHKGEWG